MILITEKFSSEFASVHLTPLPEPPPSYKGTHGEQMQQALEAEEKEASRSVGTS
jgi:hypothetical protein